MKNIYVKVSIGFICLVSCVWSLSGADENPPAIRNRKVVVFDEPGFPVKAGLKSAAWFAENLKQMGLEVTVAGAKEISDVNFLTKKKFDTLILPDGENIPFEASYSIPNFLAENGNVILSSIPAYCPEYDKATGKWNDDRKEKVAIRPRDSEFQLRYLNSKKGESKYFVETETKLNCQLKINSGLPSSISGILPAVGPFDKTTYQLDKMNDYSALFSGCRKENVETAANIICPVYVLPDGRGADFVAYRYHNKYFNNSTLVLFGVLGTSLLSTDAAKDILRASLVLCEIKVPGEQDVSYYERVISLQEKISAFGKLFTEVYYPLLDAVFYSSYKRAKDFDALSAELAACENALNQIMTEKQSIDKLLLDEKDFKVQDEKRKKLLALLEEKTKQLETIKEKIKEITKGIQHPGHIGISNPVCKEFFVEMGSTYQFGLYMLRKDFFQTAKELGANVLISTSWNWLTYFSYMNDPVVRKNREGIKFSIYCTKSWGLEEVLPVLQGRLDPHTGKIADAAKRQTYDHKKLDNIIKEITLKWWKDEPVARYWHAGEPVLGTFFWGEQAKEEFQAYLKEKYKDIKKLNERWNSGYSDFNEITLLTKKPATVPEHGNWEDWIKFREQKAFDAFKFTYDTYKKYAPNIPLSTVIVTAYNIQIPFYATNYYKITKNLDINGIDGTGGPANMEWIQYDLNCGKPVCTVEWSTFYAPPLDILEGRKKLIHQTWQQVSAGEVGINCWIWRSGGFRGNYVDTTGLPTLYGWELKNLVSNFKAIDHILLDGKRKEPQIKILYSETSRVHQQGFERGSCTHLNALTNLYSHFLRSHIPARVIDEDAVLEGNDLSGNELVIVPQAEYLSEALQKKLIEYAEKGGVLLIEGNSGKYDSYGHEKNLLLKEAGAVLSPAVTNKEIALPDGNARINQPSFVFSPALLTMEKANVLFKYAGGEAAIVSVPLGKGRIIISGMPLGLGYDENTASAITQGICKEINLAPRFICLDKDILVRDWEYKGEKYLICAYPQGKKTLNKFVLKIKGAFKIIDYLLGTEVPSKFDGVYTSFLGLITSPGGRVYKLEECSAASEKAVSPEKSEVNAAAGSDVKILRLPYKDWLYSEETKEIDGFVFQTNVVSQVQWHGKAEGKVYLEISRGQDKIRKNIEEGKEYFFNFKNETLSVKCLNCQYIFPMGMRVEINKVAKASVTSACSLKEEDYSGNRSLLLSNGLIRLRLLPGLGAHIVEFSTVTDDVNHLHLFNASAIGGLHISDSNWLGKFHNKPFSYKILKNTPEEIEILLKTEKPVEGLALEKKISLKKGEYAVSVELKEYNRLDKVSSLLLRLQSELNIGGSSGTEDMFIIPVKDIVKVIPCFPKDSREAEPGKGWVACEDTALKLYYVTSFPEKDIAKVFSWSNGEFYNMALATESKEVKPGEFLPLSLGFAFVKGLSGMDNYIDGVASYIALPGEKFSQELDISFTMELGTVSVRDKQIKGIVSLYQDGNKIKELGEFNGNISFDNVFKKSFSFNDAKLDDGKYEIVLDVLDEKENVLLKQAKNIFMTGKEKKGKYATYEKVKAEFAQLQKKYPSGKTKLFKCFEILEELRGAIEENNNEKFDLKIKECNETLKMIEGK